MSFVSTDAPAAGGGFMLGTCSQVSGSSVHIQYMCVRSLHVQDFG